MSETISNASDEDNVADEVNPEDDVNPVENPEEDLVEEDPEDKEDPVEDLAGEDLAEEDLVVLPRVNIPADNARDFTTGNFLQRRIPIRYAINDNPDRGSRNLPEPKHLVIKLPDALAKLFGGVWVAVKDEEVLIDFFARNDQNDARNGRKVGDPWRWIKIKTNGEIAMGISRPYTRSRSDGELVRDYRLGAFTLLVPLVLAGAPERAAEAAPGRLFS